MIGAEKPEIYFLGIIDVLTHYGVRKQAAYAAKTVKHGTGNSFLKLKNQKSYLNCNREQSTKFQVSFKRNC